MCISRKSAPRCTSGVYPAKRLVTTNQQVGCSRRPWSIHSATRLRWDGSATSSRPSKRKSRLPRLSRRSPKPAGVFKCGLASWSWMNLSRPCSRSRRSLSGRKTGSMSSGRPIDAAPLRRHPSSSRFRWVVLPAPGSPRMTTPLRLRSAHWRNASGRAISKRPAAFSQFSFGLGRVRKAFSTNTPEIHHGVQRDIDILDVDGHLELGDEAGDRQRGVQGIGLLAVLPDLFFEVFIDLMRRQCLQFLSGSCGGFGSRWLRQSFKA